MARHADNELNRLRRAVASYVKGLITLGISAQKVSSAGGSYLAISQLIASGIALASQLQRGIVIRVVGAPPVRRRPQRRSRRGESEAYPEPPAPFGQDAQTRDQEATEWDDLVPPSLASTEMESQPFALARILPAIVMAQESTFSALSSVNGAIARAVGNTAFAPAWSRASPSQTSLEPAQRGSPDAFPENQATYYSGEASALAIGAAFRGAASSIAFNLSSAAHEMTNTVLGSQAVGAGFAPQSSRVANEGTGFAPSSQAVTSPSLLQPSITGSADTSFQSPSPSGANLGLVTSAGASSSSSTAPAPAASPALPLTREPSSSSDLSAQVGGPSAGGSSDSTLSGSSAAGSGVELNAGPYTVPNGFNSVFSSPAFAAGSLLSMQVRSLASSGSSAQLPVRASQAPSTAEGGATGMAVVPEQYPSSYPVGVAFSVSSIIASLGLGRPAQASAQVAVQTGAGQWPSADEAAEIGGTGMAGAAFIGEQLGGRGPEAAEAFASPAEEAQGAPALDAEEGVAGRSVRTELDSNISIGPRGGLAAYQQLFGERWIVSIAGAASIASALIGLLTVSRGSLSPSGWTSGVAGPLARGRLAPANASGGAAEGPVHELDRVVAAEGVPGMVFQPGQPPPRALASPPGVYSGARGADSTALSSRLAAYAPLSVWETATLLPGILTPLLGAPSAGTGYHQPYRGPDRLSEAVAAGAGTDLSLAARGSQRAGLEAIRLATSLRTALLAASAAAMGARPSSLAASGSGTPSPAEPALDGIATPERSSGTFVRVGTSGLKRRVDRFALSRGGPEADATREGPPIPDFARAYLPALQAAMASRALLAAGVARSQAGAPSFSSAASGGARLDGGPGPFGTSAPSASAQPVLTAAPPTVERELEAALAMHSRERRGTGEGSFFGLEAVAQALSLAAKLPSAAHLNASIAPPARGARARSTAPATASASTAHSDAQYAVERLPQALEDWKSAPEEALTRMLAEQPSHHQAPNAESSQEPDDRELRRKVEKMIQEDLRRYGYQP